MRWYNEYATRLNERDMHRRSQARTFFEGTVTHFQDAANVQEVLLIVPFMLQVKFFVLPHVFLL